jgi:hypothetical protein
MHSNGNSTYKVLDFDQVSLFPTRTPPFRTQDITIKRLNNVTVMKIDNLYTISKAGHGLIAIPNVIGVFLLRVYELSIIKMDVVWRIGPFRTEETTVKHSDEINESHSSLQRLEEEWIF